MSSPEDPLQALAGRLRELRRECWPDRAITQKQLAQALSAEESASVPLISSWESRSNPVVPPPSRLEAYARFFATERSIAKRPFLLFASSELAEHERSRRDQLLHELTELREAALGRLGFWRFPAGADVTIVCADFPKDRRDKIPYADPDSPDYEELYKLTDIGALIELYGHIRSANPTNQVNIRVASETSTDDYTTHLVVLGGVDWNAVTRDVLNAIELEIPVRQLPREEDSDIGGFEVSVGEERQLFQPKLRQIRGQELLVEDVAHVYRGPNPFNNKRTVTICNGMFGRGTLGAARVFTDARFRDRNEAYVRQRFTSGNFFSIITRVAIVNNEVVTPDWTVAHARLHEWPEIVSEPSRLPSAPAEQARRRRTPQLLGC